MVIVLNSVGIPTNIPVQNTSLDIEVDRTNGSLEEREKVSKTVVKENDLRKTFPCLESGGVFTYKSLIGIHKFFDYSVKGEYSGWFDEIKSEIVYTFTKEFRSPFPWGPESVFHTHPIFRGSEEHSYTDLFLFCCSPSQKSILFTSKSISVLQKNDRKFSEYDILRAKKKFLSDEGYLESGLNSLFFSSILEKLYPDVRRNISYSDKFKLLCSHLHLKHLKWEIG